MKTKNEIMEELENLLKKGGIEQVDFEAFTNDINNLSATEKEELLLDFIKELYSIDELINFYYRHPENLNDQLNAAMKDFKRITNYSDSEIANLFAKAGLTEDNVKGEVEKNLDLDLLEAKVAAEQEGISLEEWLEKDIEKLESEKAEKLAEIDSKIEELEKDLGNSDLENLNIDEINEQIEQLNQERIKIQNEKGQNLTSEDIAKIQEINGKKSELQQQKEYTIDGELLTSLLDEKIKEITDEKAKFLEEKKNNLSLEEIKKYQDLTRSINKYNEIKNNYVNNNVIVDNEGLLSNLINEKIAKLEKERNDLMASAGQNLTPEIITKHKKLTKKIEKYKKLALLVEKKKAKDASKKEKENKEDKKDNSEEIKKLKEERKKLAHKYDTLIAKRKKQLENLKKKKDKEEENGHKKGNRKDLAIKASAGLAGFTTGLAMSCSPGIGQVRMTIATAKLAQSAVNKGIKVWTKKHPEGKIAKISSKVSDKTQKFGENHPRIASAYSKAKKFIGNDKVQWFVNGVAAGYVAGNVIEKITGKNIFDNVNDMLNPDKSVKNVTNVANVPTQPNTPDVPSNTPADINIEAGQNYDLSGLSQGLVSSDSQDYVNILGQYSKDAVVDKFKTLPSGEVMVHFTSGGDGLAWYKLSDIQEYLANGAEVVENVSKGL